MNSRTHERAIKLLGVCTPGQTAAALGVEPSYISQLLGDPKFANAVAEERAKFVEGGMERDSSWDSIEQKALTKLGEVMDYVQKPGDLLRVAQVANGAKRRSEGAAAGAHAGNGDTVVHLHIPDNALVHFQLNTMKEVVAVDGRPLAPLPSAALLSHARGEKLLQKLPPPSTLNVKDLVLDDFQ